MAKGCLTPRCKGKYHAKGYCSPCAKKRYRKENPGVDKAYEKTEFGFLMRIYRNMTSRVTGVQKKKFHLYKGKSLLPKEDFYGWAQNHPEYKRLFVDYKLSNYDRKLAPSVDRINPDLGYQISNMEWVTHSENSRRSSITRKRYEN